MRLEKKVAVITGAGSGIGRASAILFAKEGAKIVVADIDDAGGKETVASIKSGVKEAIFIHADVSVSADVANMIKTAQGKFGKIDILFNNAGIPQQTTPLDQVDEATWDRIYAVNVKSIFLTAKSAVPIMKKTGGVIINLASISGVRPRPGNLAYASSKAAVIHLTKALALELAPFKIRVNCINPVAADTPMLNKFFPVGANPDAARKAVIDGIPLGRLNTAQDIAYAALYLASDESAMLTGTAIDIDGGRSI